MREIKFRAWDKRNNRMWHDNTESYYNDVLKRPYKQNLMLRMDGDIRTCQWYEDGVTMHELSDYELMQYTGLKDKNGKEIYEGDIVKNIDDEMIGEIFYHPLFFAFMFETKEGRGYLGQEANFTIDNEEDDRPTYCPYLEVIGNIYENKELLVS